MKKQIGIFTVILFAVSTLMVSCSPEVQVHEHTFSGEWSSDETNHWHASTCGHEVTVGKTPHTFGDWKTTKAATCTEEGSKTGVCKVCEKEVTEKIDAKGHFFGIWTTTKAATCTEEGSKTGVCEVCKKEVTEKIDAKGHSGGIWETTKEATETESGKMESVCEVCGETVTKELHPAPQGFRFVEAGTFKMGSNKGYSDNKPVHKVTITKPFYMGKYEVTQAEYEKYCSYGSSFPSSRYGDGDNYPAYYVSWYDALVYCNKRSMAEGITPCYSISASTDPKDWGDVPTSSNSTWDAVECNWNANGYRLPTEAEWEYAARAGDNTADSLTYSGIRDVNKLGDYAWYYDSASDNTHEVGTKLPNAFGLYDMSGNVWEWCWNWLTYSYDTESEGGSDPTGASSGSYRVCRGGGWKDGASFCAVFCRGSNDPNNLSNGRGFRVVRLAN